MASLRRTASMRPDNATAAAVAAPGRRRRRAKTKPGLVVEIEPAAQERAVAIVGCVARCLAAALCWRGCRSTTSASGALFHCPTLPLPDRTALQWCRTLTPLVPLRLCMAHMRAPEVTTADGARRRFCQKCVLVRTWSPGHQDARTSM